MKSEIVGYVLLVSGLIVIFLSIYGMWAVFSGGSPPPSLFSFSNISIPAGNGQNIVLMSGLELSKPFDIVFWSILMFFIMWAGGKIASLGVNLIREIKVEVKGHLRGEETGKEAQGSAPPPP
jgi:hypothetical protein